MHRHGRKPFYGLWSGGPVSIKYDLNKGGKQHSFGSKRLLLLFWSYSRIIGQAVMCVGFLLESPACLAQRPQLETKPETIVSYDIPSEFRVGQVVVNSTTALVSKSADAFQFSMPDGQHLIHDYGLEGLPNIEKGESHYPVVVNSITFNPAEKTNIPERQMANVISSFSIDGVMIDGNMFFSTITLRNRPPMFFTFYYVRMDSVGDSGALSMFIRCPYNDKIPETSSSCDGVEYAEGLDLVMRLRFPRLKYAEIPAIGIKAITLLQSWKTKQ